MFDLTLIEASAIADLMQRDNAVVPNSKTTFISFANKPEAPFLVAKQAQEIGKYGRM